MSSGYLYEPLPDVTDGIRLHLNENTDGCSDAVLRAVKDVTRQQIAWYPAYQEATESVARTFGVNHDQVLLTNGLDEGILTLALAMLPRAEPGSNAVVVEPAYGMYGPVVALAGGEVRPAPPKPDLTFSLEHTLAAINAATRLVMLSNPNNPAGDLIDAGTIRTLWSSVNRDTTIFVDEAYADFAGTSVVDQLAEAPNLVVGRTFAKAYGLAGIRIGCLLASPEVIRRLRGAIAPFSVNIFAVVAVKAALADTGHLQWYLQQVTGAKEVLYEAFQRLGLPYWRSHGNFVLVRVGNAPAVRAGLAARGIHVRDRSAAPGCDGCIRMTAGRVADAQEAVHVLEEVLCDVRR